MTLLANTVRCRVQVCYHLYCYECAARVTMPKATDEWYFSSALYCGDDVCKPSLYTAPPLNMMCTNTDFCTTCSTDTQFMDFTLKLLAVKLRFIEIELYCMCLQGFPIDYWTCHQPSPFLQRVCVSPGALCTAGRRVCEELYAEA